MKTKWWLIIAAACLVVGFGLGMLAGYYAFKCDPAGDIIVVEPGKPSPPKYYKPVDVAKQCGETIELLGRIEKNAFQVLAWDDCKAVTQSWALGIQRVPRHHVISVNYSLPYNIDSKMFRHSLDGNYYYSFGPVALGGGALAIFDRDRLYDIGPRVGIMASW